MPTTSDMQTWVTIPDKTTWGEGPWVDEPDKAQWTDPATGLPCLAKRNHAGAWCGYVGVPATHPLHGAHYSEDQFAGVEVHGGLTYSGACQEGPEPVEQRICHIPDDGEPDDVWWLGFDCAHWQDLQPAYAATMRQIGMPELLVQTPLDCQYRALDFVRAECARLAEALAALP